MQINFNGDHDVMQQYGTVSSKQQAHLFVPRDNPLKQNLNKTNTGRLGRERLENSPCAVWQINCKERTFLFC